MPSSARITHTNAAAAMWCLTALCFYAVLGGACMHARWDPTKVSEADIANGVGATGPEQSFGPLQWAATKGKSQHETGNLSHEAPFCCLPDLMDAVQGVLPDVFGFGQSGDALHGAEVRAAHQVARHTSPA